MLAIKPLVVAPSAWDVTPIKRLCAPGSIVRKQNGFVAVVNGICHLVTGALYPGLWSSSSSSIRCQRDEFAAVVTQDHRRLDSTCTGDPAFGEGPSPRSPS